MRVVRRETNETASNIQTWSFVARNLETYVEEHFNEGETKLGKEKNQSSRMPESSEVLISSNQRTRNLQTKLWKYISHRWWAFVIWKCWIGEETPEVLRSICTSWRYLWKMIQALMQDSQNKVHQHHKWRQQKSWISFHGNPVAQAASECPVVWIRLPHHQWPKSWSSHGRSSRSSRTKCVWSSSGRTVVG